MRPVLKVATYNIRKCIGTDRKRNPERVLSVLAELNADIIALQEADRRFGQRASAIPHHMVLEHSEYRPVHFGIRAQSLGWHGNAILVRKGIGIGHAQILPLPTLEPRGAIMAELNWQGQELRLIAAHLDLSGLWRRRQIKTLLDYYKAASPMPTIMLGDFNQWSNRGAMTEFAGSTMHLLNSPPSFHARKPMARLDRILISNSLRAKECATHISPLSRLASDHLPLWAQIEFA
jgi:endonuclease/exonuclease/phosphatase family metal-dependent hydrolase